MENVSIQYWEQKISEWQTSGLNVHDWCQKKQIVFLEVTSDYQPKQQHNNFIPSQDNRMLLYYHGIKVCVPDNFDQNTLLSLLRTIKLL